ncbi:16S rRNA (cytosine(967)-C(5))-methyltransferase RsmB [Candidatus Marithrix sp. Canyon 246]|uniref:16S rRNA (cytosine(967)-C(5))-methyltransferase RsmB n=1 Tax=Candidatus Marithrix sp. Canyon 246 TaxID=1827136 RepID=UPI00084A08A8|nr:16S rRNA (cytosine(967)-C(5))-methyltransferase RsmB [Candidatus Marithrix sp. Canyon 246]
MNARSVATKILTQVIKNKRSLSECLDLSSLTDSRERALAQELCYGVLRWLPRLQAILKVLVKKKFRNKDIDIEVLLLIGLYQHIYLRIPPHAATSATVEVTKLLKKTWATSLVNAVLRNFQRQQIDIDHLAHPEWILEYLKKDWPTQWQDIAKANNTHPPFSLRVNSRVMSRDAYMKYLQQAEIITDTEYGITLSKAVDVQSLPGFAQGWVSVQDGAAQFAAELLDVPNGARVLDACAAPGGKSAHLLEKYEIDTLIALDSQANRVKLLTESLQRLQFNNAQIHCADAAKPESWWDGKAFDRILLDAPCSGSGVIRRHPDIKYLRQKNDIMKLAAQQKRLLEALWPLLKNGGKLLYVTCSIFAEENYLQIQDFLNTHLDAEDSKLAVNWGHEQPIGRQILPGESQLDGFYYACLSKTL